MLFEISVPGLCTLNVNGRAAACRACDSRTVQDFFHLVD